MFYKDKSSAGVETDGTSDGLVGTSGNIATLKLAANEYVNSAYGFSRENLTGLWFATNFGNVVGGGDRLGFNGFNADQPDSLNAKLMRISGNYATNNIENLAFEWEYEF